MDTGTIQIIPGLNKSKAIFENGHWIIYGSHNILDEQEPNEFVYKIKTDISKLDPKTPIYSSVNAFTNTNNNIANDYETVADLYDYVKDILQNLDPNDFKKSLKPNLITNKQIINKLVELIFDGVTWQSFCTFAEDVQQDIEDNPDCYSYLFEN